MRIVNLVENEVGASGCQAAHGLSFYIETENHHLLFDTSPSDLLLENAEKLGIDLTSIDTVILSHGHYDHSGGIMAFAKINPRAKIYMQDSAGGEQFAYDGPDAGYRYIGIDKAILTLPQLVLLHGDCKIDDELQIFTVDKRAYPLPSSNQRLKIFSQGQYIQDNFQHEQNLLLTCQGKRYLFSGCAHNGILNVLHALEEKLGTPSLPHLVLGGFHLMKKSGYSDSDIQEIQAIAKKLTGYQSHFATCHCTSLEAFSIMKEIMKDQLTYVHSGDEVKI